MQKIKLDGGSFAARGEAARQELFGLSLDQNGIRQIQDTLD